MNITVNVDERIWLKALKNSLRRIITKQPCPVTVDINLTKLQVEEAYREQELSYRTEDARNHILYDYDPDDFFEQYKFSLEQATDPTSEFYICADVADIFLNDYDCDIPENRQFESAVESAADSMRREVIRNGKNNTNYRSA